MAIRAQHVSRNFVQRVISVWLSEEDEEASDHSSDVEDGLPLGSQDIQAHVPIKVNVRVEELLVGGGGTVLWVSSSAWGKDISGSKYRERVACVVVCCIHK